MSFLGNLGIDVKLLAAQIINFGLLVWLLNRFLYKPVMESIERADEKMKQAQIQKEALEKEKESFRSQKEEEIASVKERAKDIINEAEGVAEEIKSRNLKEAEEEKKLVIKQIRSRLKEIENETAKKKSSK